MDWSADEKQVFVIGLTHLSYVTAVYYDPLTRNKYLLLAFTFILCYGSILQL